MAATLFSTRTWWSVEGSDGDICDHNLLSILEGHVAVANFNGSLRLFKPVEGSDKKSPLLEIQFDEGILEIATGKFLKEIHEPQLAVLCCRRLIIYSLVENPNEDVQLVNRKDLKLENHAANFIFGRFGYSSGQSLSFCVQSVEGIFTFVHEGQMGFERNIPGQMVPGPLCYLPSSDAIVTCSSACTVNAYRYQVLAAATDTKSNDTNAGKRVQADWSYNIGEHANEIHLVQSTLHESILVMGDRTLFWFTDAGHLQYCKRFEIELACCTTFPVDNDNSGILLILDDNTINVLHGAELKWTAHIAGNIPVTVRVGAFRDVRGLIATLTDSGHITLSFLGTDPNPPETGTTPRNLDFVAMDKEMRELQQLIRNNILEDETDNDVEELSDSNSQSMQFSSQPKLERSADSTDWPLNIILEVKMKYLGTAQINHLSGHVRVQLPLLTEQVEIHWRRGYQDQEWVANIKLTLQTGLAPNQRDVCITACYMIGTNKFSVEHVVDLPFNFYFLEAEPTKSLKTQLMLSTNEGPVNLSSLFQDFISHGATPTAVGLQVCSGSLVCIQGAKNKGRFRINCEDFGSVWVVLEFFLDCLRRQFGKQTNFQISYPDELPLDAFFDTLDKHWAQQLNQQNLKTALELKTQQIRAVQKRILIRYKDKTPSSIQVLDDLLVGTNEELNDIAQQLKKGYVLENQLLCSVKAAANILITLLTVKADISIEDEFVLRNSFYLHYDKRHESQEWEQKISVAIEHLVKSTLNDESYDLSGTAHETTLDLEKLKRLIRDLFSKVQQGKSLQPK
eukprot:m.273734 g.273734  ORF g.273734 m.273734 type:complete len:793 (-) comp16282_c7_seq10:2473-4851(-)